MMHQHLQSHARDFDDDGLTERLAVSLGTITFALTVLLAVGVTGVFGAYSFVGLLAILIGLLLLLLSVVLVSILPAIPMDRGGIFSVDPTIVHFGVGVGFGAGIGAVLVILWLAFVVYVGGAVSVISVLPAVLIGGFIGILLSVMFGISFSAFGTEWDGQFRLVLARQLVDVHPAPASISTSALVQRKSAQLLFCSLLTLLPADVVTEFGDDLVEHFMVEWDEQGIGRWGWTLREVLVLIRNCIFDRLRASRLQ